jgi:hypothetical protein
MILLSEILICGLLIIFVPLLLCLWMVGGDSIRNVVRRIHRGMFFPSGNDFACARNES